MFSPKTQSLVSHLRSRVGNKNVLTSRRATRRYSRGFRFGGGEAAAVVLPQTLLEQWDVLQICIDANAIVIAQASNTGLTGGSTPFGQDYDRPVVIISTVKLNNIHLLGDGRQVVCLPGSTLYQLENILKPLGRDPHSVIGSSCIGASVVGGVCNNSGGALVNRGPAYTELSLYAQVDEAGQLSLVNDLGIALGDTPEQMLSRLEKGELPAEDIQWDTGAASDSRYDECVRDIDASTPARYNADPSRLYGASGCAGKVMVFAVRLDTFPAAAAERYLYVGTNNTLDFANLRRSLLSKLDNLPVSVEYMHKDAFDIADQYGKDIFLLIEKAGTARLPAFFALKSKLDAFLEDIGLGRLNVSERTLQWFACLFPDHLPKVLREYRKQFEHHLMIKVHEQDLAPLQAILDADIKHTGGNYFVCSDQEGKKAFLHRFAAAGAAIRYRSLHRKTVQDIVALDIALPRNEMDWFETLPSSFDQPISHKLYYGHFLCHVLHQDYIVRKGNDCEDLEHKLLDLLAARGAQYPAEHNVGHLYKAKPELSGFYRKLDPCNCFNPGIGMTSKFFRYRDEQSE